MDKFEFAIYIIGAIVTIVSSIGGSFVAVKVTLTKHDEKIQQVKEELDEIKTNRESDFKELRSDIKHIYQSIAELSKNVAVLTERIKSNGK